MKDKNHDVQASEEMAINSEHSLLCNDELFIKDLIAIVDDTMRVEEEQS